MRNPLLVALVGLLAAAFVLPATVSAHTGADLTATADVVAPTSVLGD